MIYIQVRIKSRAFGLTLGTFDKMWEGNTGMRPALAPIGHVQRFEKVLHDARGVFVKVWTA